MAEQSDSDDALLRKLRRQFESYATAKANEIDEQRLAWRYYHADQWTPAQLKVLKDRGQPVITFDQCGRKIDGVVGITRKLRTDPKAFPRTPKQEDGAEVATQCIRTVMDSSDFENIEAECARDAAVAGIAVSELTFIEGDRGDPDIEFSYVDPRTYFYDPRSLRADFGDRRFDGVYKWVGLDEIDEIVPGGAELVRASEDGTYFTAFDSDREVLWVDERERVRLVDHWYIEQGMWKWCLHVGSTILGRGDTPFQNRLGKPIGKFFAFSNLIDSDGDRYGFIRRLKGPQDAMNQHRSKAMHIMNTRQLIVRKGTLENVEATRREAARPDGVIEYDGNKEDFEISQPAQEFIQQTQYFQDARNEIENFGPNPALLGDLGKSASGRAYAMAQQAGLAELGPFLKNFRMWKLEQYQAAWTTAQRYWTTERMIRVTDNEGLAQFMPVNGMEMDPQTGQPMLVNALGAIDVDIIIDEGPDTENVMGDVFDTLQALASSSVPVPPEVIIETSTLPGEVKKKLIEMMQPKPNPEREKAQQLALAGEAAKVEETQSKTMLNVAKARSEGVPDQGQPAEFELPPEIQVGQALAEIENTRASAEQRLAQANKTNIDAMLAPQQAQAVMRSQDVKLSALSERA